MIDVKTQTEFIMIDHLDHLVLTTANESECIDFYTRVMKMRLEIFVGGTPPVERKAFQFGHQKINLHIKGKEFEPKADCPTPGSLDLCFIASGSLSEVIAHLKNEGWPLVEGPVMRTGARSKIRSVYVRDPDLNLIEISEEVR
jgi:catechol 2,3-dioxygenase-like lactoylglutathione lyase family enzyme